MTIPVDVLIRSSQWALAQDLRLLQGHRLAETDLGHVAKLLDFMCPKLDTSWLDVGCGFGEAARLMHELRPDLTFTLLNNSGFQLDHCPDGYTKVYSKMEDMPLPTATFDGCMFLYSLCQADSLGKTLCEAARVTKPGGELFVYDYERLEGNNYLLLHRLYARAVKFEMMREIADVAGWNVTARENPTGDDTIFRRLYGNDEEYTQIFHELRPVLWKAVRA
jgi:ubiquinone/menaquinone biosynthesis C-methylase UbiE